MTIQEIKSRYGIIGNSHLLDHSIKVASQVAPTEISVLISGESGVGKEVFPQIIHFLSARKHGPTLRLTAEQYLKARLTPNYLDTRRGLSPVHMKPGKDILKLLMAAPFF